MHYTGSMSDDERSKLHREGKTFNCKKEAAQVSQKATGVKMSTKKPSRGKYKDRRDVKGGFSRGAPPPTPQKGRKVHIFLIFLIFFQFFVILQRFFQTF